MVKIGHEIKRRLRQEVGCAMRCNIGIAPNRFLAKTAAGLNKPDGLDVITADNLRETFAKMELTDITGITGANERRLNSVRIFTSLEFLDADEVVLRRQVFKSICGTEWHQRLRGYEVDKRDFPIKSAGRQYVLEQHKLSYTEVMKRLHHLCEEVGSKVRSQGLEARGVSVHARSYEKVNGRTYWHSRHMAALPFFSDQTIHQQARQLFKSAPSPLKEIGVSCYELSEPGSNQVSLFGDELARTRQATSAVDDINQRYGARTVHSAATLGTNSIIKAKTPFGSTRYM